MQYKLKSLCDSLTEQGVYFLLSNSDTQIINELYAKYHIERVFASRAVNCDGQKRGKITEVLIRNY